MRRISTIFIISILLFTGCNGNEQGNKQGTQSNNNPDFKRLAYQSTHPQHAGPISDQQYRPIAKGKTRIETLGFLDPSNMKRAVTNVNRFAPHLTYVGFFNYRALPDGNLVPLNDHAPLQATKKHKATPMMVITNLGEENYSEDVAYQIFTDPIVSNRLIGNVLQVMKDKGYRALNVDFEHIREKDIKLYNSFLAKLLPAVKKKGYMVSTDLAPKIRDDQGGEWAGAHDYAFHGKVADFVVLMTYDWAYSEGPPSAIAPTPEIRKVLDYAVSRIPREKIMMGFPLYGYDWILPHTKESPPAKIVSPQEAITIAQQTAAKIQYSNREEVPYFNYQDTRGRQHEVWFENEQSAQAKFNLVKEYRLRGLGYWAISHRDFSRNWSLLDENFIIRKY